MSNEEPIDEGVVDIVAETMRRASQRRAAQVDDVRSLEERIAEARKLGLLADASDLRRLQELLADAHLTLWRLLGTLGEGMLEPSLEVRLRAALVPGYLRDIAQGAEALLSYAYRDAGGLDALVADRAEHRDAARELHRQACTCQRCLLARAGGREGRGHED